MSEHALMFLAILHTEAITDISISIYVNIEKLGVRVNGLFLMASSAMLTLP